MVLILNDGILYTQDGDNFAPDAPYLYSLEDADRWLTEQGFDDYFVEVTA